MSRTDPRGARPEPSRSVVPMSIPLWLGVTAMVAAVAIVLATYARVLAWPFLFDDPIHIRWLASHDFRDVWLDIRGMQHYRPLVFSLWRASFALFGSHCAMPLHLVTLLLHAANAWLVAWLAYRLTESPFGALAALALFAAFPFSYQVMPSPGSQSKPLSTWLILMACYGYWRGRSGDRVGWLVAAAVLAMLAPFAYEAAITSGGLLVLMELLLWRKRQVSRPTPWVLAWCCLGLVFLLAWKLVPNSYDPVSFPGLEALWQNSVYFCQAMTWPVALLAKRLVGPGGLTDLAATALVSYGAMLLLTLVFLRRNRWYCLVFSLGWALLALAVQGVTLSFRYVIDGPRVLYVASVGMALLWACLLAEVWERAPWRLLGRSAATVVLLLLVACGVRFARSRMAMTAGGFQALEDACDLVLAGEPDDTWLLINVPRWLAPTEESFALGHEGYTILPPYYGIGLSDYCFANRGVRVSILSSSLPDIRRDWDALIGYHQEMDTVPDLYAGIRQANHVAVLDYMPGALTYIEVGGMLNRVPDDALHARFGESIELRQAEASRQKGCLQVALDWYVRNDVELPLTVFMHLYGPAGQLVAQADGAGLGGTWPLDRWRAGDALRDIRRIPLDHLASFDGYYLGIGIYRSDGGQRLPVTGDSGALLAHQTLRLELDANGGVRSD